MIIEIEGLPSRSTLRPFISRKLAAVFDGLRHQPTAVRVGFTDENGPKGGNAIRCGINVDVPRRAPVHVEDRATTERLAFDSALEALERRVVRDTGRGRAERRRPKKYFVAKRLLMPDETLDTLAAKERPVRRAGLGKSA